MKKITGKDYEWLWTLRHQSFLFISLNGYGGLKPGIQFELLNTFTIPPHHIISGGNTRLNHFFRKSFSNNIMCNSADVGVNSHFAFRVRRDATKPDIKAAVELMFSVKVAEVNVVNEPGKTRRFGKTVGRTQDSKKAYVRLAPGQSIDYEARKA